MMVDKGTGGPAYGHSVVQPPRNVEHQRQIDDLRRRVEALERAAVRAPARDDLPAVIAYMTAIVAEFWGAVIELRHETIACPSDGSAIEKVLYRLVGSSGEVGARIGVMDRIHSRVEATAPAMVGWVALEELF
jgi:hypothetical protein